MTQHRDGRRARRGISLIELIIVIGIVAVSAAVVLPAAREARLRAQSISCESNLRTLYSACVQYSSDHQGRFPFGFTFTKFRPTGWSADGGRSGYITWFSLLDMYLTSGAGPAIPLDYNTGWIDGATTRVFHPAFKCPSVPPEFQQQVHYYQHGVVMPHLTLELGFTPAGRVKLQAPARFSQTSADTALVWDTQVYSMAKPQVPSMFWGPWHAISGYAAFCTMIDEPAPAYDENEMESLLSNPQWPERRFRDDGADRFLQSSNPLKHPLGPIGWVGDRYLANLGLNPPTLNTDLVNTVFIPGNARFRHMDLTCNVLFADGSVRALRLFPNRKVSNGTTGAANFYDSEFRRNMLMITWPGGGIVDSGMYPTN